MNLRLYDSKNDYEKIDADMGYKEEIVALQERLQDFNDIVMYTTLCSDDRGIMKSRLLIIMLRYCTFNNASIKQS